MFLFYIDFQWTNMILDPPFEIRSGGSNDVQNRSCVANRLEMFVSLSSSKQLVETTGAQESVQNARLHIKDL